MANDLQRQLEALRAAVRGKEATLADLEADVLDLRRELGVFQARYDRIVGPTAVRLDAVRAAIADLEAERDRSWKDLYVASAPPIESSWEPPPDYVPVEEQFRRTWKVPLEDDAPEAPTTARPKPRRDALDNRETRLKSLYRKLARRYHPDLATDPAEQDSRNALMARINEAYTRRDLDALWALADQTEDFDPAAPLATLQLQELRQIDEQLSRRIQELRFERANLMHSDMMQLAIEEKLAKGRGRDLLAELAAGMEREYEAAMRRLDQLRRS